MSSDVVLDTKGLVLAPGELSRGTKAQMLSPGQMSRATGSLTTADNVNICAPGVIRSRNGLTKQTYGFGGPGWKFASTKELGSNLLFNHGNATRATGLRYGDGSVAPTAISGNVTNQPETRMQVAVSRRNHYLTSDEGVRRIETDYSMAFAGMPKGLALDLTGPTAVLSGAPGTALSDGYAVAYCVTWCKNDQQSIPMEGAPSSRTVVYNNTRTTGWVTGVVKNVTCRILIPKQANTASTALTTSYYYRLYRSAQAASGVPPSDNMRLVAEGYLTSGNISAGYVEVVDSTPEAYRGLGEPLYTNPSDGGQVGVSGFGLAESNNTPPFAHDVCLFAECLFYSDLTYQPALEFTILSVVPGTGLTAADTLTIGGITYTAIAPGTPANNEFVVVTSTGPTATTNSESIERTAQNLCEAINKSSTNVTVWASYISSPDNLPGKIRLEARDNYGFSALASAHGAAYLPAMTAAVNSVADTFANGYAFSKPSQGDAVPAVNVGFIGRNDTALLRMQVLRDSIFFFTDAGIYRLTGDSYDTFSLQEFDLSFRLLGRENIVTCDDAIYAWGYEGIARITPGGVEMISNAIEPLIQSAINNATLTWFAAYGWATAYRSQHRILFAVPASAAGNNAKNCSAVLVYDTRMQAWSRWTFAEGRDASVTTGHSCGAVRVSDDLLFMGQWNSYASDSFIFKERRTYAAADYVDATYDSTSAAIVKTVTWNAATSSPNTLTHWQDLQVLFDVSQTFTGWTTPTALSALFVSDLATSSASISLVPTATSRVTLCSVPRAQRRSARLAVTVIHNALGEYFGLEGMVLVHEPGGSTNVART